MQFRTYVFSFFLLLFIAGSTQSAQAFSVLTHQAIIDVSWEKSLLPTLKKKFPEATEEQLLEAHAYAYGGAIIQDLGYYPFGSKFFTDLTHYVRSGDFILNLISESDSLNEYAFALGALSHYYADVYGHSMATNKSVPLVYPELKAEHGDVVAYEEDPLAHARMEFGYDVLQVARGNYAPQAYHDFIGFKVAKEVLERAFLKTYGLELKSQFVSAEVAIATYRFTIRNLIPDLTKAAWEMKEDDIKKARPGITKRKFQYQISKAAFHQEWGSNYQKPGFLQKILAFILRILPKFGPDRVLKFKPPTPEAEQLFMQSFNTIAERFQAGLKQEQTNTLALPNRDLDTGKPTKPHEYHLADETYAELVNELAKSDFKNLTEPLKQHILTYFNRAEGPAVEKEADADDREDARKDWQKTQQQLEKLKAAKPVETE